jgi:hypothetical protein
MMNTMTQIRLPTGQVIDIADWSDKPIYSTVDLGSSFAEQTISLFQYVSGQQVPGYAPVAATQRTSTLNDTNMANPGEFATTEEMLIYAIKPEVQFFAWSGSDFNTATVLGAGTAGFPAATLAGIAVLQQALLLELEISQKIYAQAGFGYFVPGFGAYGIGAMIPAAAATPGRQMGNNGLPSQEAVRSFSLPNHIGGQEKFRVNLVNGPGLPVAFGKNDAASSADVLTTMCRVRIYLDGLYKRPTA